MSRICLSISTNFCQVLLFSRKPTCQILKVSLAFNATDASYLSLHCDIVRLFSCYDMPLLPACDTARSANDAICLAWAFRVVAGGACKSIWSSYSLAAPGHLACLSMQHESWAHYDMCFLANESSLDVNVGACKLHLDSGQHQSEWRHLGEVLIRLIYSLY
jgi:hypothetical protein